MAQEDGEGAMHGDGHGDSKAHRHVEQPLKELAQPSRQGVRHQQVGERAHGGRRGGDVSFFFCGGIDTRPWQLFGCFQFRKRPK